VHEIDAAEKPATSRTAMNAATAALRALACAVFLLCLGGGPALAASWQEVRDAGFRAFSDTDYREAARLLEQALAGAREAQASAEDRGVMLHRLTTAYFAARFFRRARASIARWDEVLVASAGEPWAEQQRVDRDVDRDVLAVLVSEVLGEPIPEPAPQSAPQPSAEPPPQPGP
jgi:hypothetical protein